MASPDRNQLPVRFLPDQYDRVCKIARRKNLSRAAFVISAAMAACDDDEEERRIKRQRKQGFTPDEDRDENQSRAPGLGIREVLTRQTAGEEKYEPAANAPVVVNVNTGSTSSPSPLVEKLAVFVVKGPAYLRDQRRRQCDGILRTDATNEDERRRLSAALDAEVQKLDAKREGSSQSALDRLKAFLR